MPVTSSTRRYHHFAERFLLSRVECLSARDQLLPIASLKMCIDQRCNGKPPTKKSSIWRNEMESRTIESCRKCLNLFETRTRHELYVMLYQNKCGIYSSNTTALVHVEHSRSEMRLLSIPFGFVAWKIRFGTQSPPVKRRWRNSIHSFVTKCECRDRDAQVNKQENDQHSARRHVSFLWRKMGRFFWSNA